MARSRATSPSEPPHAPQKRLRGEVTAVPHAGQASRRRVPPLPQERSPELSGTAHRPCGAQAAAQRTRSVHLLPTFTGPAAGPPIWDRNESNPRPWTDRQRCPPFRSGWRFSSLCSPAGVNPNPADGQHRGSPWGPQAPHRFQGVRAACVPFSSLSCLSCARPCAARWAGRRAATFSRRSR